MQKLKLHARTQRERDVDRLAELGRTSGLKATIRGLEQGLRIAQTQNIDFKHSLANIQSQRDETEQKNERLERRLIEAEKALEISRTQLSVTQLDQSKLLAQLNEVKQQSVDRETVLASQFQERILGIYSTFMNVRTYTHTHTHIFACACLSLSVFCPTNTNALTCTIVHNSSPSRPQSPTNKQNSWHEQLRKWCHCSLHGLGGH